MSQIYPNIVPENDLRLPDALTIKHGPAQLLARFVLEGDKAARQMGLRLRLRHDFGELLYLNKREVAKKSWFPLVNMFNPEYSDLTPENSYWLSGEDQHGEIMTTHAGHVYYWPNTTLEQEANAVLYGGRDDGPRCMVTARDAKRITGVVVYGGSAWVRPDFRGQRLSGLLPRLGRAYALSRWPVDWGFGIAAPILVQRGVTARYGYKHESRSIIFPGAPSGAVDNVLVSISAEEAYDDFAAILSRCGAGSDELLAAGSSAASFLDIIDTKTSSDEVFQGSSNRS